MASAMEVATVTGASPANSASISGAASPIATTDRTGGTVSRRGANDRPFG